MHLKPRPCHDSNEYRDDRLCRLRRCQEPCFVLRLVCEPPRRASSETPARAGSDSSCGDSNPSRRPGDQAAEAAAASLKAEAAIAAAREEAAAAVVAQQRAGCVAADERRVACAAEETLRATRARLGELEAECSLPLAPPHMADLKKLKELKVLLDDDLRADASKQTPAGKQNGIRRAEDGGAGGARPRGGPSRNHCKPSRPFNPFWTQ